MYQKRSAIGSDALEVQFNSTTSPREYLSLFPSMYGSLLGTAETYKVIVLSTNQKIDFGYMYIVTKMILRNEFLAQIQHVVCKIERIFQKSKFLLWTKIKFWLHNTSLTIQKKVMFVEEKISSIAWKVLTLHWLYHQKFCGHSGLILTYIILLRY